MSTFLSEMNSCKNQKEIEKNSEDNKASKRRNVRTAYCTFKNEKSLSCDLTN